MSRGAEGAEGAEGEEGGKKMRTKTKKDQHMIKRIHYSTKPAQGTFHLSRSSCVDMQKGTIGVCYTLLAVENSSHLCFAHISTRKREQDSSQLATKDL